VLITLIFWDEFDGLAIILWDGGGGLPYSLRRRGGGRNEVHRESLAVVA